LTLDKRNVGRAYPAIVEMDGVLVSLFGKLSDSQGKREEPLVPQFVEHLLNF